MDLLDKYPITVVIPTRNSMPELKAHIDSLNGWLHRVRQVVVVDSESTDGTAEYLREHLKHDCVEFLNHPPGLYQSWNAAIKLVLSEYTYIATVNDFMPFETLAQLYSEANRLAADVVVSAPELVSEERARKHRQWPIHRFLESSSIQESYVLQPLELLVWNSVDLPGTLIGSSASNLYRTAKLQQSPFPCDYGHAGDSAWAVGCALASRWVIVPRVTSQFWCHGGEKTRSGHGRRLRSQLYALTIRQIECAGEALPLADREEAILEALRSLSRFWRQKEEAVLGYRVYRDRRIPWFFFPRAWMLRSDKNRSDLEIRSQVQLILQEVGDLYCYDC